MYGAHRKGRARMEEQTADLLNVAQVRERTGASRSAIYQAINDKRLPSVVIGGHIFVRSADLANWNPLPPSQRKGLSIGGRKKKTTEQPKRRPGRPRKAQETQQP